MKSFRCLGVLVSALAFIFIFNIYAKTIYILNFNDFHSMIYHNKTNNIPGMIFFMNAIFSEIKKYGRDNVVLISGGDNYQGTVVSYDTKGAPISDMFRELGVNFSAVGNHEFDWEQKAFDKWQKDGNFVYLAANVVNKENGKTPAWFAPYKMVKVDGVKIAFIGLSTIATGITTKPKNLEGLKITEPWGAAQYWIDYLNASKDENGVPDIIVALTHIPSAQDKNTGEIVGEEINNLCLNTKGFDVVISAHSHETVCGRINEVLVIQAECYGRKYGVIKIDIDDRTKIVNKIEAKVCSVPTDVKILSENNGERIFAKYSDIEKKYSEVIGESAMTLHYNKLTVNALGVYMAKIVNESIINSQIAFINGLGIRGGLEKGDITLGDIYRIFPFKNTIVSMKLSGKSIKAVMEHGLDNYGNNKVGCIQFCGMKVVFDHSKPVGNRVVSMILNNGQEIQMAKYYSICINDFMFSGGDNYKFDGATDIKVYNNLLVRDILIDCIKKEKFLTLPEPDCLTDLAEKQRLKESA